ncbi:MAG: hypothetical protein WBO69_12775, partial [Thermoanaerobaculia bacterium]
GDLSISPKRLVPFVMLLLVFPACGKGVATGGGGPTEPPVEETSANIVENAGVRIGLCTDLGLECSYSQDYRNVGTGCANNVRGKIRAFQNDTLLETVEWSLATSIVIQPGEIFPVEDCCITSGTAQAANRYTGEAFWNNVSCS